MPHLAPQSPAQSPAQSSAQPSAQSSAQPLRPTASLFRSAGPPDAVARVLEYAERLAPCGLLASRRAVEPAVLADVLPSIFLIDVESPAATARWRLVGEALRPFLDGSPRGQAIDSVGPPGFRVLMAGAVRTIAQNRSPIALDGLAGTGGPQERRLRFDLALVPLADDGRRVNAALGALVWRPLLATAPDPTAEPATPDTPAALAGAIADEGVSG